MVQPRGPEPSDSLAQMSQQAKKVEDGLREHERDVRWAVEAAQGRRRGRIGQSSTR